MEKDSLLTTLTEDFLCQLMTRGFDAAEVNVIAKVDGEEQTCSLICEPEDV